jgi:hypothetical protein
MQVLGIVRAQLESTHQMAASKSKNRLNEMCACFLQGLPVNYENAVHFE